MRKLKKYIYKGYAVLGICCILLGNTYIIAQAEIVNKDNLTNIDDLNNKDSVVLEEIKVKENDMVKITELNSESKEEKGTPIKAELTAYCDDDRCSGSWGNKTAMETKTRIGVIAAPSNIKLGSKMYIPELKYYKADGIFNVEDRGGAIKVKEDGTYIIDVWFPTYKQAVEFGRKTTTVYLTK